MSWDKKEIGQTIIHNLAEAPKCSDLSSTMTLAGSIVVSVCVCLCGCVVV